MKKQLLIFPFVLFLNSCEQQETANVQEAKNKQEAVKKEAVNKQEEVTKQEAVNEQVAVREVKQSQLVNRNSVFYVGDEETPFTGKSSGRYKNGQLRVEGSFVNGKRDGLFRNWDEGGQLVSEKTFANGKRID